MISEEVILKWYNEAHSAKGKMMFVEQMKKFVEWLQNAEEGNTSMRLIYVFLYADSNDYFISESESGEDED